MINLSLYPTKSTCFIWMLFVIPSCVFSANELYKLCSGTFSCGNQRELYYPFWTSGREECGHPDFKLDCSGGFAEINISSVKFRILAMTSGYIRLARSNFIDNLCPSYLLDEPFDENVLLFPPDTEMLTIYYDCERDFSPPVSTIVGQLNCPDDKTDGKTNYYVRRNLSSTQLLSDGDLLNAFSRFCYRNVGIPANGPALTRLQRHSSADNLKKALTDGFEVGLNHECLTCLDSSGACGFNLISNSFTCYSTDEPQNRSRNKGNITKQKGLSSGMKIGSGAGVTLFLFLIFTLFLQILRKRKTSHDLGQQNLKAVIPQPKLKARVSQPKLKSRVPHANLKALIPMKQYSYAEVKRITKSFAQEIGRGGFGTVYRGALSDGRKVAVKVLKDLKGNSGEDFINEVASMSQTSHINIATLLGFCSEGSNRAIIYEFLENGSLDKFISSKTSMNMDWAALYRIALGVARGLEYLHHGYKTRIVHFDIKPHNVLLDDNFCPKVSDFGLAKLCKKKESILSLLDTRGTIGYIAPEVFSRMYGGVSHKSDVYSYGMLVLEMIGARDKERTNQNYASNPSSMYFPEWIYKDLEKGDNGTLIENAINIEEEDIAKKMTLVGLWCIQPCPQDRPAMNRVVEMMEGNLDALKVPPRPVYPAARLQESFTLSEDISVYSEIGYSNIA